MKEGVVVGRTMVACNDIVNSSTKELYANYVIHFTKVCEIYPNFIEIC